MKKVLLICLIILSHLTAFAQDNANSRQAKRVFNTAWNHIYGQEGVKFNYKINILGLYKEEGYSCNKRTQSSTTTAI